MLIGTCGLYFLEGVVLFRAYLAIEVDVAGIATAQRLDGLELTLEDCHGNLLDSLHSAVIEFFCYKVIIIKRETQAAPKRNSAKTGKGERRWRKRREKQGKLKRSEGEDLAVRIEGRIGFNITKWAIWIIKLLYKHGGE